MPLYESFRSSSRIPLCVFLIQLLSAENVIAHTHATFTCSENTHDETRYVHACNLGSHSPAARVNFPRRGQTLSLHSISSHRLAFLTGLHYLSHPDSVSPRRLTYESDSCSRSGRGRSGTFASPLFFCFHMLENLPSANQAVAAAAASELQW